MSVAEQATFALNHASLSELNAILDRSDGLNRVELDPQIRTRAEERRLDLAHAAYIRSNLGTSLQKKPSLDDISPLPGTVDEAALTKIVVEASAQRRRRLDDVVNAERFLRDLINVAAAALAVQPAEVFDVLFGRSND